MTPLEQARQQQKKGCDTCAKRVVLRGVSYCEVSGKVLLPSLLDVGQCMHSPSDYEPKPYTKSEAREKYEEECQKTVLQSENSVDDEEAERIRADRLRDERRDGATLRQLEGEE